VRRALPGHRQRAGLDGAGGQRAAVRAGRAGPDRGGGGAGRRGRVLERDARPGLRRAAGAPVRRGHRDRGPGPRGRAGHRLPGAHPRLSPLSGRPRPVPAPPAGPGARPWIRPSACLIMPISESDIPNRNTMAASRPGCAPGEVGRAMDKAGIGRRFAGRAGILTGAASGIGRATALRLSAEGARLLLVDLAEDGLAETLRLIGEQNGPDGPEAAVHPADVSDEAAVRGAVEAAAARFGAIDLLVNVAGFHRVVPLEDITLDYWNRQFAVNAAGTMLFCREAMPHLEAAGGVVVNTA